MPRAIISAGHTSSDKGAEYNGLVEFELTRKIAGYVVDELRKAGILTLTVPPDMDLGSRIDWINNTGYNFELNDIALEIHVNDGGKSGVEGWYKDKGENESFYLTKAIVSRVCSDMNLTYQGVKSEFEHPLSQLAFVHMLNPVPALVECLYIDNEADRLLLQDDIKLKELGRSISYGILDYWKIEAKSDNNLTTQIASAAVLQQQVTPTVEEKVVSSQPNVAQQPGIKQTPPATIPPVGAAVAGFGAGVAYNNNQNNMNVSSNVAFSQTPISFDERERRRLFIEDLYLKALGRKPTFQDTAYFINNWDGEVSLVKRMLDSQDHSDILQKAIESDKVKEELKERDNVISRLKIEIRDKDGIIDNLNRLVIEKNTMINDLRRAGPENTKPDVNQESVNGDLESENDSFIGKIRKSIKDKL